MVAAAYRDEQWNTLRHQVRAAAQPRLSPKPLLFRGLISALPLSLGLWGILLLLVRRLIGG